MPIYWNGAWDGFQISVLMRIPREVYIVSAVLSHFSIVATSCMLLLRLLLVGIWAVNLQWLLRWWITTSYSSTSQGQRGLLSRASWDPGSQTWRYMHRCGYLLASSTVFLLLLPCQCGGGLRLVVGPSGLLRGDWWAKRRCLSSELLLLHVQFSVWIEKLEEVLLDAMLARRAIRLLLVVFLIKILTITTHVLHVHWCLVDGGEEMLRQLRVLRLRHRCHHWIRG